MYVSVCLSLSSFLEDRKVNAIVLLLYHETNVFTDYCIVSNLGRCYRKLQGHCREPLPSAVTLYVGVCVCSVTQSCPTLCDSVDCSPLGSSVHRISQPRILEWVITSSSGDLLNPGMEPTFPALQVDTLPLSHQGSPPGSHQGSPPSHIR